MRDAPAAGKSERAAVLIVALYLVLAAVLYRPWQHHPLPITDFSEFLPLLSAPGTALERLGRLNAYFLTQGRANVGAYAYIVASWELFGQRPWLWDTARFCLMGTVVVAAAWVLCRFGIPAAAAAACAGLFIVTTAASHTWMRLTGEPVALLLLCAAFRLAIPYSETRRWGRDGLLIALLLVGVVLMKEVLVVTLPAVLWVAWSSSSGPAATRRGSTARNLWVTALVLVTSGALLVRAANVMSHGGPDSYAATYAARSGATLGHAWLVASRLVTPVSPEETGLRFAIQFPANLLTSVLLLLGAVVAWPGRAAAWPTARRDLGVGALLLAGGTIIYAPWPRFEAFYAFPFLLALALWLGHAISALASRGRLMQGLVAVIWVAIIAYSAAIAQRVASADLARRDVDAAAVGIVGDSPAPAQLLVATSGRPAHAWEGRGATLRRFALAAGYREPLAGVRDIQCDRLDSVRAYRRVGQGILVYSLECGHLEAPDTVLRVPIRYLDYGRWQWLTADVGIDVLRPLP